MKYGFGFRFSVLGLLEFIDWGGGDILYHTSKYLSGALNDRRYAAPPIIEQNMAAGRIGLKTLAGFPQLRGDGRGRLSQGTSGALSSIVCAIWG